MRHLLIVLFHFFIGFLGYLPTLIITQFTFYWNNSGRVNSVVYSIISAYFVMSIIVYIYRTIFHQKIKYYTFYWNLIFILCTIANIILIILTIPQDYFSN
jgi:hypothetical protein